MFVVNVAAYLLLLLLWLWGISAWMSGYTRHGESIKVPHLRGFHISEGGVLAAAEGLELIISDSIYVENMPGGTITEQNPDSGFNVKDGRKIYVTVSTYGIPKIILPNLKYDDKRNVVSQLEMLGFRIGETKYIPSTCVDCLEFFEMKGNEIQPGARLNNGATIDLVLGGGKSDRFIPVPDLRGMHLQEAIAFLRRCSLSTGNLDFEKVAEKDSSIIRVFQQKPEPASPEAVIYLGMPIDLFFTDNPNLMPKTTTDTLELVPLIPDTLQ
jgi:beta-lactam-binding protein with PASTA domain